MKVCIGEIRDENVDLWMKINPLHSKARRLTLESTEFFSQKVISLTKHEKQFADTQFH